MTSQVPDSRILVYGVTGSGKTTLARRIAEKTGLPWHSVDDLTFEANWVTVPLEEQRRRIEAICAQPQWVLDAAYGQWLDIPLGNVDLIVALDYSRALTLYRLSRRTFIRLFDRRPICNGNRETLRTTFSRESIILWHFRSFSRKRARIRKWAAAGSPKILRFRHPREAEDWLSSLVLDLDVPV